MNLKTKIEKTLSDLDHLVESTSYESDSDGWVCDEIGRLSTCTTTANWLADRLGGEVVGYFSDDNPTAELGSIEGGHDFVLVDGRYIVDWWAKDIGYAKRRVYDVSKDKGIISKLYGDPAAWKKLKQMNPRRRR